MFLLIFRFWIATVLSLLKNCFKLLADKALEIIRSYLNMEEVKHKVGLRVAERIKIFEAHYN